MVTFSKLTLALLLREWPKKLGNVSSAIFLKSSIILNKLLRIAESLATRSALVQQHLQGGTHQLHSRTSHSNAGRNTPVIHNTSQPMCFGNHPTVSTNGLRNFFQSSPPRLLGATELDSLPGLPEQSSAPASPSAGAASRASPIFSPQSWADRAGLLLPQQQHRGGHELRDAITSGRCVAEDSRRLPLSARQARAPPSRPSALRHHHRHPPLNTQTLRGPGAHDGSATAGREGERLDASDRLPPNRRRRGGPGPARPGAAAAEGPSASPAVATRLRGAGGAAAQPPQLQTPAPCPALAAPPRSAPRRPGGRAGPHRAHLATDRPTDRATPPRRVPPPSRGAHARFCRAPPPASPGPRARFSSPRPSPSQPTGEPHTAPAGARREEEGL